MALIVIPRVEVHQHVDHEIIILQILESFDAARRYRFERNAERHNQRLVDDEDEA